MLALAKLNYRWASWERKSESATLFGAKRDCVRRCQNMEALRWEFCRASGDVMTGTPRNPERHSRRCAICRSPMREEIETDYVAWESPSTICKRYRISSRSTLHTHVRALRLYERRDA